LDLLSLHKLKHYSDSKPSPEDHAIINDIYSILENSNLTDFELKIIEKIFYENWDMEDSPLCESILNKIRFYLKI
jgi:hypothetical protein